MKKTVVLVSILLFPLFLESCSTSAKSDEKEQVVKLFTEKTKLKNGYYSFTSVSKTGSSDFLYDFSYEPTEDKFYISSYYQSVINNTALSDYGEVAFDWGAFKKGYFSGKHSFVVGYHEYVRSFRYTNIVFNDDLTLGNYKYKTITDTFESGSTSSDAQYCFECIEQAILNAQSVLYKNKLDVTLW